MNFRALAWLFASWSTVAGSTCPTELYAGFDSRIKPRLLMALPKAETDVADFAVAKGRVIVLGGRRLLVGNGQGWAAVPILEGTRGMAVALDGHLQVVAGPRIVEIMAGGRRDVSTVEQGLIVRTGKHATPTAVEVLRRDDGRFLIRASITNQQPVMIADLVSKPVAVGWNQAGLSFVADDTLWTWRSDKQVMRPLVSDTGLRAARSTCLLPDGRTIVGLNDVTLVVSQNHAVTLAAFGAYCDVHGNGADLLDPLGGVVWTVDDFGSVGIALADVEHARALISGTTATDRPNNVRHAEATRILGCKESESEARKGSNAQVAIH